MKFAQFFHKKSILRPYYLKILVGKFTFSFKKKKEGVHSQQKHFFPADRDSLFAVFLFLISRPYRS